MERILLVESDPQASQLIAEQILRPLGYHVDVIASASPVILDFGKFSPDLIITNLHLPEISGKDLMVALTAEGRDIPFIVITPKGQESDALQAFRLGAVNFISSPIREAEVVSVIEDTLRLLRRRSQLENYSHQLDQSKAEMEHRVRDFTEIFLISSLVASAENLQLIYEKITRAAVQVTQADAAWLLVFDTNKSTYILRACVNTDENIQANLDHPYEDGLSSIAALSGQVVSIHGDGLKRFKLADWIESALVQPIKKKEQVTGLLVVVRRNPQVFTKDHQSMLGMIAEYASILFDNSLRFKLLEQRMGYFQQFGIHSAIDSDLKSDLLLQAGREINRPLKILLENIAIISDQGDRRLSPKQSSAINLIQEQAEILTEIVDTIKSSQQGSSLKSMQVVDLNQVLRDVVNRFQPFAQVGQILLKLELPTQPCQVTIFTSQITRVIEGMLSNALKYSPPKSQITASVESKENCTLVKVKDQGDGVNENLAERLFDKNATQEAGEGRRFCGIGISLPMMKEIISAYRGRIWIESGRGKGFSILFSLPHRLEHPD